MEVKKFGIAILKTPDRIPVSQELPEVVTKHQAELLQLAWTYPEEFNYPWVDWRTGEIVVDVATAEEFQFATQLRNDHQIKQRIRRVKYSLAQLRRIRDDLFARKHIEAFSELNSIREIEMDLENNRLVVLTDQVSDELLITLATRWSGDGIAVRQIQKRTPSTSSFQANEEPVCTQTFAGPIETRFDYTRWRVRGGSCVNGGKVCTNGFSWHYGGDIYGMISAGHCFANGDVQYASAPSPDLSGASGNQVFGQVWGARWENWKPRLGTCAFDYSGRDTCPNPPIYGGQAGDLASIQMKQYSLENARIFTGFTATAPVREMGTNNYSNSVCTGGSVSGQVCGWAVDALWTAVAEYDKSVIWTEWQSRYIEQAKPVLAIASSRATPAGRFITSEPTVELWPRGLLAESGTTATKENVTCGTQTFKPSNGPLVARCIRKTNADKRAGCDQPFNV